MADHTLTPAQRDAIDATVARLHRERADAPTMAAKYDSACERISEMHDEIVRLRRQGEALEDQLSDAQQLADRRWVAWQSARRRHVRQRDAQREAIAADRDLVRLVRDRYRNERDAARAEAARESKLVSEARHERDTARQEARTARREADADRVRLLGIVNEWVTTASEYGDLVRALEGAGYTLPGADDEETDR